MQTIFDIFNSQENIGVINLVINDTQSAIFSVDKTFVSYNVFINKVMNTVFELSSYHKSDLTYKTFKSRKPTGKIYYDNDIYTNIINKSNKVAGYNRYLLYIDKACSRGLRLQEHLRENLQMFENERKSSQMYQLDLQVSSINFVYKCNFIF